MNVKIAYEKVARMLNEWYGTIKRHQVPKAISMKEEIQSVLPYMEENQDLLLYFNLLDLRHNLMLEKLSDSKEAYEKIKKQEEQVKETNKMIQYYSLFFSGVYEFYKKNFIDAINYYRLAEDKLKSIPDEIESAEFHYKLAHAYYQIDQHFVSLSHAKKAKSIFNAHEDYKVKAIACDMMFGANLYDMYQLSEAEELFQNTLHEAKAINNQRATGIIYHNLGLIFERKNVLGLALEYFKKAMDLQEHFESQNGIRSMYMAARVLYESGDLSEGLNWYKNALTRTKKCNEEEYKSKLKIIYSIYEEYNQLEVNNAFKYLETKNLWSDVSELAEKVADFHKKTGDLNSCTEYLKKALNAKTQILKVTEALA
ncbi:MULTISPECIES: tetratricopeptide repeat protein [Bacillus]|uniref:Response regulator aspartate phosphatase n=1 Tax=Bacillus sonorensis TaxID=119858 RepID=A0ABN5AH60_9BACI|nr:MULTISPECIES: tetratricopeptide repeat protein [Bacillus]ASB88414.1 Response regulator aspartate phosphatase [Bacillus sonorensis]NWN81129.1 tetratricopeptide repeat protein [Bacillus sp. (in: firmicutes)]RHJ05895.1 tetratricopeptide repeat protein [Bacillus sonorensis]GIN67659.1 response regulator aspartate phosphatase I [Bacillus sonorensis]